MRSGAASRAFITGIDISNTIRSGRRLGAARSAGNFARSPPINSPIAHTCRIYLVRTQRHFRIRFQAWTSSWMALALGKWPGPIRQAEWVY